MVHALKEVHRVLAAGGYLADVRPYRDARRLRAALPHVSCLVDGREVPMGMLEESVKDSLAANQALQKGIRTRLFTLEAREIFSFKTYFQSLAKFDAVHRAVGIPAPRAWKDATLPDSSRHRVEAFLKRNPLAEIIISETVVLNVLRKL